MKEKAYKELIGEVSKLNHSQLKGLIKQIDSLSKLGEAPKELETKFEDLNCPHCGSHAIGYWGNRNRLRRYRCNSCKKTFNSLTGTPLARLRKKEHWLDYAECINEGLSLEDSANACNVSKDTSFRWRHRFLENVKSIKADTLEGIVEGDETFFLESKKGSVEELNRKARKRGGKAKKRGISDEQVCVLVCRDRHKNTYDEICPKFNSKVLEEKMGPRLSQDAILCTDSKNVYKKFALENQINHEALNSSKGEHVRNKYIHIQNVNAYHSRLKDWVDGFRGVSTKYLDSYLGWFRMLDEFDVISPELILHRAKAGGKYKVQPLT